MLRVLIGCKSENIEAIESILTLIYAKEITAYIEDSQLAIIKEYIYRFASSYADTLISDLERDFKTYSVTSEDIERVSELAVESLHTGIAIACAERKKIDIVIAETVQVVYEESDVCVVNPEEFVLRYDSLNRCLKDDANIPRSSIVNAVKTHQGTNFDWIDPIQSVIDIKFGDWNIESFETVIQFKDETKASVKLWNERKGEYIAQNAVGNGPVDALVQALNFSLVEAKLETIIPPMIVDSVYLQSEEKGADSLVRANVSLVVPGDESIRGEFRHTDTVKAVFCACIKATADYVNQDKEKRLKNITVAQLKLDLMEQNSLSYENICLQKLDSLPLELLGLSLKYASIAYSNFAGVQIANYSTAAKWEKTSIY